jgi:hypothetical protein
MANTWHATVQGGTYTTSKNLIDLFNSASSATTVSLYRMWLFNNGVAAITGVLFLIQLKRSSAASLGTAITPIAHNLANTALDVNTTAGHGRTVTSAGIFRQLLWQQDEAAVTTLDMDALLTLIPFAEIWNSGYGDANIQPITCRAANNEGVTLFQIGTTIVGTYDAEIEFTSA